MSITRLHSGPFEAVAAATMTAVTALPAGNASSFKFTSLSAPPPDFPSPKPNIAEPCAHLLPEVTA